MQPDRRADGRIWDHNVHYSDLVWTFFISSIHHPRFEILAQCLGERKWCLNSITIIRASEQGSGTTTLWRGISLWARPRVTVRSNMESLEPSLGGQIRAYWRASSLEVYDGHHMRHTLGFLDSSGKTGAEGGYSNSRD